MRRRKLRGDFPQDRMFFGRCAVTLNVVRNPLPLRSLLPSAPCFARVSRFRGPIPAANYKV